MLRSAVIACCALVPAISLGQAPSFDAEHVYYFDHPVALAPGLVLSIFGNDLGPSRGCQGEHDAQGIYPKSLCDTQVLVGGIPSGLLWVQASQINFQVPGETPLEGTANLAVVYRGRSSKAVVVPLGAEGTTISLEGPARVGMPVWLKVKAPYNQESGIRYPFMIFPAAFGCNEVEVRRDGMPLTRIADLNTQAVGGYAFSGFPCGSVGFTTVPHFKDRLPLHLQYRFDQPGTYEVRLTERHPFSNEAPWISPWIAIEILPADAAARKQWLEDKIDHAPTDAADLLTDCLPSILGNPDDETLRALRPYLYHPDRVVREYAMRGLTYWPEGQVVPKVLDWMRVEGPSDATVDFVLHANSFAAAHANELAELSIPYLEANPPVLVYGAVRAVSRIVLAKDSLVSAEIRARAADALIRAVDHAIAIDPQNANEYVSALGQVQNPRAHELLLDLVNRSGLGAEQARIALTWIQ
jgi:hypothetical protein